ncbi:MAG: group 1 truncated hemoglobin [Verrucomicrobiales bacterium]|nr:group 1 truncated hemoglobin [Verrucomicrobiales bacterium]
MNNEETTLYERIGGEDAITGMLDSFYKKVTTDPELSPYFKNVPMDRLQRMQREFFSSATGGPIKYSGRPLAHVHHPLAISSREFQRFTQHLIETLQEKGIDEQDVLDVIARVNLYADEITNDTTVDG